MAFWWDDVGLLTDEVGVIDCDVCPCTTPSGPIKVGCCPQEISRTLRGLVSDLSTGDWIPHIGNTFPLTWNPGTSRWEGDYEGITCRVYCSEDGDPTIYTWNWDLIKANDADPNCSTIKSTFNPFIQCTPLRLGYAGLFECGGGNFVVEYGE
jgi:hypothetical protein